MWRTASYTHKGRKRNTDILMELQHETNLDFHTELQELIGNAMFLACPVRQFHFKCYFINQRKKDPHETLEAVERVRNGGVGQNLRGL
jgi:hypothetical protein